MEFIALLYGVSQDVTVSIEWSPLLSISVGFDLGYKGDIIPFVKARLSYIPLAFFMRYESECPTDRKKRIHEQDLALDVCIGVTKTHEKHQGVFHLMMHYNLF